MKKLIYAAAALLALAPGAVFAGTLLDATPGQTVTKYRDLNPAILRMLEDKGIETTNADNLVLKDGQVVDSPLDADWAEELGNFFLGAQP